jgi:prolyl-tRNA synthetase
VKFSQLDLKTKRTKSKEIESVNADLLIRAGFIDQLGAGIYSYLPLGLSVFKKIENIIRDEMDEAGGIELLLPALHPAENWKKTGRWDTEDNLFRFTSYYTKNEYALGATHEEVIMPLMKKTIDSYRDLPRYVYQIQNKFRDEKRSKAGLLRCREFVMKDFYSFHADEEDLDKYYEIMKQSYTNIYNKVGIGKETYITFASGGSFSKFSHEFQTISASGEDTIFICKKCRIAINKEVLDIQNCCPECESKDLHEEKAIEVGNIFKNKTKYTKPFDVKYTDKEGKEKLVVTGCYGIGLGRLMGAIVEVSHDDKGIIWPNSIAPYSIYLASLGNEKEVVDKTNEIYQKLRDSGTSVLFDDREESAGIKFADCDLIGLPLRVIISKKTIGSNSCGVKERTSNEEILVREDQLIEYLHKLLS